MLIKDVKNVFDLGTTIIITGIEGGIASKINQKMLGMGIGDVEIVEIVATGVNEITVITNIPDAVLLIWNNVSR